MSDAIQAIPLDNIDASFGNDRTVFDAAALVGLADSIRENGLAQPVTVRKLSAGVYQLVAGERRTRAVRLLHSQYAAYAALLACFGFDMPPSPFASIRAIVATLDDDAAASLMLAENTGRRDLDPIDEARAYARRMSEYGWDERQVGERAGVGVQTVRNRLALLKLRDDIQFLVRSGNLQIGYGQIIAEAELDNNRQLIILKRLNECPAPTPNWLRRECATLAEAQASNDMFETGLFVATDFSGVQKKQAFEQKLPADPRKDAAPRDGATYQAMVQNQIDFWTHAADLWDRFGKSAPRDRCLAAAAALQSIVEIMPKHSNKSKKVKTDKQTLVVYAEVS